MKVLQQNGSNVTVTLKNTTLDDKAQNKTFTIPVATESAQGTTTWAKIKELAKAEAETVAGGGSDVAVKGLGSAAYTDSTAYDTKGSASTAETNAKEYADSLMTWEEFE